jgi:hypothetical protein
MKTFKVIVYISTNFEGTTKEDVKMMVIDGLNDSLDAATDTVGLITVEEMETDHDEL